MEYGLGPVSEARGENPLDTISFSLESGEIETEGEAIVMEGGPANCALRIAIFNSRIRFKCITSSL